MARPKNELPQIRRHAATQRGYLWGAPKNEKPRRHYLGAWPDSYKSPPEELVEARRGLLKLWGVGDGADRRPPSGPIRVGVLTERYLDYAEAKYTKGGKTTSEVAIIKAALRRLNDSHAGMLASDFDANELESVQLKLCARVDKRTGKKLAITSVRKYVARIAACFAWAKKKGYIKGAVPSVREVDRIKPGQFGTVPVEDVEAVDKKVLKAFCKGCDQPLLAAAVKLAATCGARPAELLKITPSGIRRSRPNQWLFEVHDHKTSHHETGPRILQFWKNSQAILKPLLKNADPSVPIFGRWKNVAAFRRAITRQCERLGLEPFTPNMLRHRYGSDAEAAAPDDIAAVSALLGHRDVRTTEVYLHRQSRRADALAAKLN